MLRIKRVLLTIICFLSGIAGVKYLEAFDGAEMLASFIVGASIPLFIYNSMKNGRVEE